MRRILVPGSLILLVFAVAASAQTSISGEKSPDRDAKTPDTQTTDTKDAAKTSNYSKEAFVIEQAHWHYHFENDGTGRIEQTFRVRVQSEAGVQAWGQLRPGYNSANESEQIAYVHVLKADGTVVKAGEDAIQDLAPVQPLSNLYTDYREKHVTVPALRPGDVLEFQFVKTIQTPLANGQFWMQHDFNQRSIVLDEQLDVDIPGGRTVKVKSKPGMNPKVTDDNGRRVYRWTSSHLTSEEEEKEKNEKEKLQKKKKKAYEIPDVQLTTFQSWEEVGRWYAGLEKDRRQPSKEVRAKAEALTQGLSADMDKAEALYDFVAKNFRYVSLSLGMGRYQPHSAAEVLQNAYGDCKDKHTLLAALLEAEGLHASAVLINSFRKLDPDVPSPAQFNHVITLLPLANQELWMDTTTEVAPFRLLSYNLRKKQALVVPAQGTPQLEETPADPPMMDFALTEIGGKVSEGGRLDAKISYTFRGDAELWLRVLFRHSPSAQWKTLVEGMNKALGGDVSDVKVGDPAATREPFTLSYQVSKGNFADWSKKKLQIKLPLSEFRPVAVSADVDENGDQADAASEEPFKIGPAHQQTYRVQLELASRYTPHAPVPVNIERDYAAYHSNYKLEGNTFSAERTLVTHVGELPPARADDYRAFRRAVLADAAQVLNIESAVADTHTAPAGMKPEDLISSGNEARRNGNYALAISLLNRAVEADPKSKLAWNDLGNVYRDDYQDELAINAFQKQIEINPYHQNAYDNLGRVYLRERKYDEAEKWFRKQLEIDPLHQHALTNLGIAFLEQHNYEDALPQLDKAAQLAPNDAMAVVRVGQAYLGLSEDDKAMAAFDKAVQISATPLVWNDIAYQLTLKKSHMDIARRYAESAVSSTEASVRNISLDSLAQRDLRSMSALASYWDTLGWIEFTEGNIEKAQNYVSASWQLDQRAEVGDHLGQIYAKRGDKAKAAYYYALALNVRSPEPETRVRLSDLVGGSDKVDVAIEKYRNEPATLRAIQVEHVSPASDGNGDFFILLSRGDSGNASVEAVKFISGEDTLKAAADTLRGLKYVQLFPDKEAVKILRRGTLSCKNTRCALTLAIPDEVSSVD